jgi:hypothetical protein
MSLSTNQFTERDVLVRTGSLIAGCTVALTVAFLGVVGLVSGNTAGLLTRLPLYVLASSVVFIATLLLLDDTRRSGQEVLVQAVLAGVGGFVVIALGVEGIVYAVTHPSQVVASHLFIYLVSASIIASGLGYWSVRNWRDVGKLVEQSSL